MAIKKPTVMTQQSGPSNPDAKLTTPSGMSINEIALLLKSQDPTIKFSDAKKKAQELKDAESTAKYGRGCELGNKIIGGVIGKKLAAKVTKAFTPKDKIKEAKSTLKDFSEKQMAEQMKPQLEMQKIKVDLQTILGKLDTLSSEIKELKTSSEKVAAAPVTAPTASPAYAAKVVPMKAEKSDDELDLEKIIKKQFPDFKKADIDKLVASTKHLETLEAKALAVLQARGRAEKIPKPQVAPQVAKVQADMKQENEDRRTAEMKKQNEQNKTTEKPTVEQVKPAPATPPPPPKVEEVKPPTPAVAAKSADTDEDQKEAREILNAQKEEKARKEQEKREEAIEKTLEDIKKKLADNGIADLIAMALGALGSKLFKLIGKGMWTLVKLAGKAAWESVKLAWKGAKALFSSLKNLLKGGEKAGAKAGEKAAEKAAVKGGEKALEKAGEKVGAEEAAKLGGKTLAKSFLKKIPLIGAVAGLAFAASDLLEGDTVGAGLDAASGLVSIIPGVGTAASIALDATKAARDFGVIGDKAGTMSAKSDKADALAKANEDKDEIPDMDDDSDGPSQPVVVHQDNRKTIVAGGGDSGSTIIKVRNDEPSVAGLTASLFDHPVSYGAVYRM
jgi:hypothetical protein